MQDRARDFQKSLCSETVALFLFDYYHISLSNILMKLAKLVDACMYLYTVLLVSGLHLKIFNLLWAMVLANNYSRKFFCF